jgi:hypothetical protein
MWFGQPGHHVISEVVFRFGFITYFLVVYLVRRSGMDGRCILGGGFRF